MLTRGMFHAVTKDDLKQLRRTKDGPMRRNLIREWDERWPEEWRCSTDKSWKFIFVALAFQPGPSGQGLGGDMFYGKSLHRANFYVIGLVPNEWLTNIVNALQAVDEEKYRTLFFSPKVQTKFSEHSFREVHGIDTTEERWCAYSWQWLQKVHELFCTALEGGRSVVFSAENC